MASCSLPYLSQHHQLREDLEAGLADAPDGLLALLEEEVVDDLAVEEVATDVLGDGVRTVDDLAFDPGARLLVDVEVVILEESLSLLRGHVGSHLRYEVDRNDLALLVVVALQLEGQADDLLAFLGREFVGDLGQQDAGLLSDLGKKTLASRCELLMSLMRGSMKCLWKSA